MLNINSFESISAIGRKGRGTSTAKMSYLIREQGGDGKTSRGCTLSISPTATPLVLREFGKECGVLFDRESETIAIVGGSDRSISLPPTGRSARISVGAIGNILEESHGDFRTIELDGSWDTIDGGGRAYVLKVVGDGRLF